MKIMFASLGAYGHLYPMMPLALASAASGHQTVIATGPPFLGRLPLPTIPGYPPELELDWAIQEARRRHPEFHDQEFSMASALGCISLLAPFRSARSTYSAVRLLRSRHSAWTS